MTALEIMEKRARELTSPELEIDFYYDLVSPYCYFAFEVIQRYMKSNRWKIELHLKPCHLGGVLKGAGNQNPLIIPFKANYRLRDLARNSDYYGVPNLHQPKVFPIDTQMDLRMLLAVQQECPEYMIALSRCLWKSYWVLDKDISREAVLKDCCKQCGMESSQIEKCLELAQSDMIKELLKENTNHAVKQGAFGLPAIFVRRLSHQKDSTSASFASWKPKKEKEEPLEDPGSYKEHSHGVIGEWEMFFGSDRFPILCHMFHLTWEGPNPDGDIAEKTGPIGINPMPKSKL